ncbi:hypothetical protein PR048_019923 [Dryococelus australis]|uniref:Uncharacterized protein n=1 Tax=Dryococelus australis TaxID=614101 RepID=A0ABQ9H4U3_9NEOP|nr:hypothetical protein PR048_019923 [Dryococelus australis]
MRVLGGIPLKERGERKYEERWKRKRKEKEFNRRNGSNWRKPSECKSIKMTHRLPTWRSTGYKHGVAYAWPEWQSRKFGISWRPRDLGVTSSSRLITIPSPTVSPYAYYLATMVERLVCLPPTKANRVQSAAGSLPVFRMWESCRTMPLRIERSPPTQVNRARKWELCRTMPLVSGFARGSPVSPAFAIRRSSMSTLFHPHRLSRPRRYESTKYLHNSYAMCMETEHVVVPEELYCTPPFLEIREGVQPQVWVFTTPCNGRRRSGQLSVVHVDPGLGTLSGPFASLALSGNGALDPHGSVTLITAALLDLKRGRKLHVWNNHIQELESNGPGYVSGAISAYAWNGVRWNRRIAALECWRSTQPLSRRAGTYSHDLSVPRPTSGRASSSNVLISLEDGGRDSENITEIDLLTLCWTLPPIGVQGLNVHTNRIARYCQLTTLRKWRLMKNQLLWLVIGNGAATDMTFVLSYHVLASPRLDLPRLALASKIRKAVQPISCDLGEKICILTTYEPSASVLDDVICAVLIIPQLVKVCYVITLASAHPRVRSFKFCQRRASHTRLTSILVGEHGAVDLYSQLLVSNMYRDSSWQDSFLIAAYLLPQ